MRGSRGPRPPRDPLRGLPGSADDWVDPQSLDLGRARVPWLRDRRLLVDAHTGARFAFAAPPTLAAWEQRRQRLRRQILASAGLWPLPERTALDAEIVPAAERDGYTIERVRFAAFPGFLVTGNLTRPSPLPPGRRLAGVLRPHGHIPRGRFTQDDVSDIPRHAANLALRGCAVLAWDMVGYGDSTRLYHHLFEDPEGWLWGASVLGLQLWSSIRCLDFLCSLPCVDASRIACTGESGGGTQTFLLAAVDDRVRVSVPVNMVSARFQGGCTCENAPGLRFGTCNVEIAAMAAPRPQMLVSCTGDWTSETPEVEAPMVRRVYALYGAESDLECVRVDADHNYNRESREAVYPFLARHLGLPAGPDREVETPRESEETLRWPGDATAPPAGLLDPSGVRAWFVGRALEVRATADGGADARQTLREALAVRTPGPGSVRVHRQGAAESDGIRRELYLVEHDDGACFPAVLFQPESVQGRPVLLVHPRGRTAWATGPRGFGPGPMVRRLLGRGRPVLAFDAFLTGEYLNDLSAAGRAVANPHFFCFNPCDTALRVQDVVTASEALCAIAGSDRLDAVGAGGAGLWCLLARPFAPRIASLAADWAGFRAADDGEYTSQLFIPGIRRAGGVEEAVALAAPAPLLVHGIRDRAPARFFRECYRARGAELSVRISRAQLGPRALAAWLDGAAQRQGVRPDSTIAP